MLYTKFVSILTATSGLAYLASAKPCSPQLPTVHLGYERHKALSHDQATDSYLFQNIRYAQSPTGELRFRAPVPPLQNLDEVQTGSELRVCPQGLPEWQIKATAAATKFSNLKEPFSIEAWIEEIRDNKVPDIDFNNGTSEDCLFLDVHVPRGIFERRKKGTPGSPVLVWIHGGGGVLGAKNGYPQPYMVPSGILSQASFSDEPLIFVGLNYRLGALGYLDSPAVRKDGNANVAHLDQRLALNWVQDNIHLFGGDKNRVTAMGESGGGGSIILQMAADSEEFGPTPFSQAIIQSPAYIPTAQGADNAYEDFLEYMNVTTLEQARAVDEKTIIAANGAQIGAAPASTYLYGSAVDGKFLKTNPMEILRTGNFNKSVTVLAGHNSWEGSFFFSPDVTNDQEFGKWVRSSLAGLSDEQVNQLVTEIYPAVFDGSIGYTSQETRQMALWGEGFLDCNYQLLSKALNGQSYAYEFSVLPGFHTQDLRYTFNAPGAPVPFPKAQAELQAAIVSFTQRGVPKMVNATTFPRWGDEGTVVNITATGALPALDKVNSTRCEWWSNI